MTEQWLPFGQDNIVRIEISTTPHDSGYTEISLSILSCTIADIYRFAYNTLDTFYVSNPVTDDGIPIYPVFNDDGETRIDKVKLVVADSVVQEAINGVLCSLDEWIRSKFALSDQHLVEAETYTFTTP